MGQRIERREERRLPVIPRQARSPALAIFLWSRAAMWFVALAAFLLFEPNRHPRADRWDSPRIHDSGWVMDVWARWDSVWIVRIAEHGYAAAPRTAAFFPFYPGLVGLLGHVFFGHYVLAGVVVSLAASLGSFLLLHRLAEDRLGADGARRAVLYLAVFPMTLFLSAVYTESLFLFFALLAFVLAERSRFLGAGLATAAALLTRFAGIALLPALAVFAWRSPQRGRALAQSLLPSIVFFAYPWWLNRELGDAWAFKHSELDPLWYRHTSHWGPLAGIWDGLRAGWAGIQQFVAGPGAGVFWEPVHDTTPMRTAAVNLEQLAFLILFIGLTVVAWRRLGAPYGLFAAVSLAIPLSIPSTRWPLLSMPRFGLVVFPFFLALAALASGRPRLHTAILCASSMLLGLTVAQWALWQWVA